MSTLLHLSTVAVVSEPDGETIALQTCQRCGGENLTIASTRTAFWDNDRLVMVEGIPTIICLNCREQHYSDETVVKLDLLRGSGFPTEAAARHIAVPVFSLDGLPDGSMEV